MINEEHLKDAIERGKREILSDIASGRVPSDVTSFSQLHDYVDANEYGGLCDTYANEGDPTDDMSDEWIAFGNAVQDALNEWIVARRWASNAAFNDLINAATQDGDESACEVLYDEYGMNAEDIAAYVAHRARMLGGSDV